MPSIFSQVGKVKPKFSKFNLSHSNTLDTDFGLLVPIAALETLPGDVFKMDLAVVGRLATALVSPAFARFDIVVEAFDVPKRLLAGNSANFDVPVGEDNLENFMRRGKDGKTDVLWPVLHNSKDDPDVKFDFGGIADFLGIEPAKTLSFNADGVEHRPIADVWRAYRYIWNEFYRNEYLQEPIQVAQWLGDGSSSDDTFIPLSEYDSLLRRGWKRDRFTSALPFQQFGTAPAFNVQGIVPLEFTPINTPLSGSRSVYPTGSFFFGKNTSLPEWTDGMEELQFSGLKVGTDLATGIQIRRNISDTVSLNDYTQAYVDLSDSVGFDISDFRTGFQIQKWMERNARAGSRLTEQYRSHFGIAPSDWRLQRPYFINSMRLSWINSEVLQTSASQDGSTAQGNQAGQSICLGSGTFKKYRALEYGYIMFILSVVPKTNYQQGMPPMFQRHSVFDLYFPEFAHLSEQAIPNWELYLADESGDSKDANIALNEGVFGFQPIWNEFRYLQSHVSNHMRSNHPDYTYDYWHIARDFAETPILNSDFLLIGGTKEQRDNLHRIFAVQQEDFCPFILHCYFNLVASRPMPFLGEPGLVDHF